MQEGPTREATRALAAWTPPPPSKATADTVTRGRRSASSYAAYSTDDSAAFASALDKAPPRPASASFYTSTEEAPVSFDSALRILEAR